MTLLHHVQSTFATALLFSLAACSSNNNGSKTNSAIEDSSTTKPEIHVGALSGFDGVKYTSGSLTGETDANGIFEYEEGKTITFSIGDIILGEVIGSESLGLADLASTEEALTNLTLFLNSLDDDGNPDNGILISAPVANLAEGLSVNFNQGTDSFKIDGLVETILSTLTAVTSAGPRLLVDTELNLNTSEITLSISGVDTAIYGTEFKIKSYNWTVSMLEGVARITSLMAASDSPELLTENSIVLAAGASLFTLGDVKKVLTAGLQINLNGNSYQYGFEKMCADLPCENTSFSIDEEARTMTFDQLRLEPQNEVDNTQQSSHIFISGTLTWTAAIEK